ncbi:MAG: hypothetical protein ACOCY6_04150, partial [Halodesulfurarchaeum sp.]
PSALTAYHYTSEEWVPAELDHLGEQRFRIESTNYSSLAVVHDLEETGETTVKPTETPVSTTESETTTAGTTAEQHPTEQTRTTENATSTPPETATESPGFGLRIGILVVVSIGLLLTRAPIALARKRE